MTYSQQEIKVLYLPPRVADIIQSFYSEEPSPTFEMFVGWYIDSQGVVMQSLQSHPSQRSREKKKVKNGWRYVKAKNPSCLGQKKYRGFQLTQEIIDGGGPVNLICNGMSLYK